MLKRNLSYLPLIALLLLVTNDCWSQDCSTFSAILPFGIYPSPCDTALGAINCGVGAQGGVPPFQFTIDPYPMGLQGNSLFDAIAAGDYVVTIIDQQGCIVKVPVTVPSNQYDTLVGKNSEWEDWTNWSAGLPSPCSNVVIDSGQIVINSNVTINSLHLNNGAKVTVDSGYNLTVLH